MPANLPFDLDRDLNLLTSKMTDIVAELEMMLSNLEALRHAINEIHHVEEMIEWLALVSLP